MVPELLGGRYKLGVVLGRGGMSEVRDGWDTRLDRAVAIKLLHPFLTTQLESRRRFEREARSAAGLNHPNIVAVHDAGEHGGTPYIVMERLPGRSLADVIASGPVPQPLVAAVLDQVLAALAFAHGAGVLHRDIKPGNILFSLSGDAKVADFGIAKSADADQTATGQILGTMAYLSPQRVTGAPACARDDVYALGVVGYEALTGRRPFIADNPGALARAIMDERPAPVASLRPDVDPLLAAVVDQAMAADERWRFGSAADMRAALSGRTAPIVSVGATASGTRPPTMLLSAPFPAMTSAPPRPRPLRTRKKLLLAAAVLAAMVVAAVAFVTDAASRGPTPASPAVTSSTMAPPSSVSPIPPAPVPTPTPAEEPGPNPGRGHGHKGRG